MRSAPVIVLMVLAVLSLQGQDTIPDVSEPYPPPIEHIRFCSPYAFWEPSASINPPRVATVTTGLAALFGAMNIWLFNAWYAQYERTAFHSFNDAGEWLQLDKAGHMVSAYYFNRIGYDLYRWSGLRENAAMWAGVGVSQTYQLLIEVQDGFTRKWGFSWTDMAANLAGSAIFAAQHYSWGEQRFVLKGSSWPAAHPEALQDRVDDLYGSAFREQFLKDYNATTYWLTFSPGSFVRREHRFPDWIGISIGYGGRGMYGGFENRWCHIDGLDLEDCPPEAIAMSAADIERVREFYLSLDVDLTRIRVRSNAVKALLEVLNVIKLPFPALEVNSAGGVKWHWIKF